MEGLHPHCSPCPESLLPPSPGKGLLSLCDPAEHPLSWLPKERQLWFCPRAPVIQWSYLVIILCMSPQLLHCTLHPWGQKLSAYISLPWQRVRASYMFSVEEQCLSDNLIFDYRACTLTQKLSSKMYKLKHKTSHQDVSQEWLGQSGWLAAKVFNKKPS